MPVRLHLFGSPTLDGSVAWTLPFERRGQLIAHLALRRTWIGRAELAALMWPDQLPKRAYGNLRKTLFRLQDLPWAVPLESHGASLRCTVDTDVHDFEQALRGKRHGDAIALYRGPLLAGFDDDANEPWSQWLRFERERLRALWRGAALEQLGADADANAGIELTARLLDADPLDEAALQAHTTLLVRAGQSARAREVCRDFVARLRDELGIAPGPELAAHLAALGKTTLPAAAPPLAAAQQADAGFVGRAAERRRIAELMARADVRLLSIIGSGGIGKTRLAQRVLQELASAFDGGAVFVALEDVATAYDLGVRIARDADVALQGSQPPLQQLAAAFGERALLLVLDNFEQLVAEAAQLEALLAACPRLKLIVTSRVRLGLAAEQLFALEGLPCPEPEDSEQLESFDAAQLFVAAARRVAPALVPAAEAAAIIEICRRVDGLPLALELAASFTRLLSCEAIAAELREGAELLRTADASRPRRQASFEVVFEQTWRHLVAAERDALTRLALFRGGFTATAARSVAGLSLPLLAALADKSLLRKDGARCHLHPLVQQLALERLDDAARTATASAHAGHYLRLFGGLRRRIRHAERDAMREAETEFENVRAAWRWSIAHGPGDELARAALSLMSFCNHRGRRAEGAALLREAIAGAAVQALPRLLSVLLGALAQLELRLDHYADAEQLALRALAAARELDDCETELQASAVVGAAAARLGRLDESKRWFERALALAGRLGDATHVAQMLDNLAFVERTLGRLDEALRLYRQALLRHREIGDFGSEALCLNNLGVVHVLRDEIESAREMLQASRTVCERHALPTTRCMVENNLAEVAMRSGDMAAALVHAREAIEIGRSTGQRTIAIQAGQVLTRVALHGRDLATARAELCAAIETAIAIGHDAQLAHCACCFAELLAAQGENDCACRVIARAIEHPALVGSERADAMARLARWGGDAARRHAAPVPPLDELCQRIVVETPLAHAPLIAQLRDAAAAGAAPPLHAAWHR